MYTLAVEKSFGHSRLVHPGGVLGEVWPMLNLYEITPFRELTAITELDLLSLSVPI